MRKLKGFCSHEFPEGSRKQSMEAESEMVYQCSVCGGHCTITKKNYQEETHANRDYQNAIVPGKYHHVPVCRIR